MVCWKAGWIQRVFHDRLQRHGIHDSGADPEGFHGMLEGRMDPEGFPWYAGSQSTFIWISWLACQHFSVSLTNRVIGHRINKRALLEMTFP